MRKATRPAKIPAPVKTSMLEQALRGKNTILLSSTESLDCVDVRVPPPDLISPIQSPMKPAATTTMPSTVAKSSTLVKTLLASPQRSTVPKTPSPQRPSQKFLNLQTLRKSCNKSRTPCSYTFLKGPKKGEKCGGASAICSVFCSKHQPKKPRSVALTPFTTSVPCTKLRINRLKRGKRYFFVRMVDRYRVRLMCDGVHYTLLLPLGMEHPERPSSRHYLIRNLDGHAEWKQAPKCTTIC